jgi:hypothetical protein
MKTRSEPDRSVNDDNAKRAVSSSAPSSLADDNSLENVLILQGGGSLGAFGCGAFKGSC